MPLFFKDRIPDPIHGENNRYYDALASNGTVKLSDFKLVLKNNIPMDKLGDPANAGNFNFASGNRLFRAASAGETHKGNIVSLISADGVIPTKTTRAIAAQGPAYSTSRLDFGYLRLSDTKLLLIYHDRMVVATVNFANKTVAFGTALITSQTNYTMQGQGLIVRDFDESSSAMMFCMWFGSLTPSYVPAIYTISASGDVISAASWGSFFSTTHTSATNPAKVGSTSVLVCTADSSNIYASLFECATGTPALTTRVQMAASGVTLRHTLFCTDKAAGKYLLIYATSASVYAVVITVSGNNVSFGTPQLLGTKNDTIYPEGLTYMPGGMNVSEGSGKIILINNTPGQSYGPSRMQVFSVNTSGVVSKGAIYDMPIQHITERPGSSCLTYNKSGKIYLTGADFEVTPRNPCLLEIALNGTNASMKKYKPFRALDTTDNYVTVYGRNAVYENPNNPDELLFIQGFQAAPVANLTVWFGRRTDCMNPGNIMGIAIDEPENGYVRVQTTAKYLPDLFTGLSMGQSYTAGDNGSLMPYTGASGTNPLGFAASPADFQFFGATNW